MEVSTFIGLHHTPNPKDFELQLRVQKIRGMMTCKESTYVVDLEELIMVDVIQRLGLEDYFRAEIHATLERLRASFSTLEDVDHKLYEVALSFRLLRHQGYHVSADIFNQFKDKDGKFKQVLCKDVKALLSLFECSQLITAEDEILGEANDFSVELLRVSLNFINEQSKARIIENTLRNPYHKNLARLLAKNLLLDFDVSLKLFHDFSDVKDWVSEVQELARTDFDIAQMIQRHEIQQISTWKIDLNLDKELSFARIEPIKWCKWSTGILPGPNMSEERLELAKAVSFIYMIDDIFDSYETSDDIYELNQFTEAVHRWEYADINHLPNCMKVCFQALLATINDFCSKIQMKHGWNPQKCLRKLWAEQCNAYLVESKWRIANYSPSPEEYLNNGIVSSGTHIALAHVYFLLGQGINEKSHDELISLPSIVSSTATILRLWNDAGIHTDRTPNGIDGSYVDWYMKEQKYSSYDSAILHVNGMISNAWKCLNKEYISSTSPFSKDFKLACLNLARIVPSMYSQ